eukprot:7857262-Pyramimonas_sp.AAC.1
MQAVQDLQHGNSVYNSNSVDVKGNMVDVKGKLVDVKGNNVDVKGNNVDVKGNKAYHWHLYDALLR